MTTSTTAGPASIRRATQDDAGAIQRVLAGADLTIAGVAEIMREHAGDFFVAESSGAQRQIVAVSGLDVRGDMAVLRSVAVHPDWRGRGVGQAVVRQAIADADARGIHALYLLTVTAERFFPRFGFERVERARIPHAIAETVEFASACPATAVAMVRNKP